LEWGHPIRENGVGTGAWLITATDCDENERLIAELRRRMESKERFLALLAHEIRGPLAPIANALRVVQENAGEPAIVRRCCATLARQVAQLVRFADDLFDLARSQSARFLLADAPVRLDTVIEAAVEASQPEIAARQQRLTVEVPTGVTLAGDAGRLTQVFANLLINAAKFTDRGGHIDILAEVEPGGPIGQPGGPMGQPNWVLVRVRDSGCGIPREMLARIFEAHVQGSAPFGTAGAGLGLALVRHLVELHGGAVSASSSGPGRGSEFLVRLPALGRPPHHDPWRLLEPLESVAQRIEERPREPDV
jgi:signal transduction histidine kinase